MEVSYETALAACVADRAEKGVPFTPQSREDVFRIYWNIQEENEKKKLIGKRVCGYIGGIPVYETYIIDDTDPAATR